MEFFKIFPSEIEGRKDISVEIGKGFGDAMDILKELKCKGKLKHSAKNNVCIRLLQRLKSTHSLIRGFLYKVAPPELKNSPIIYFVIHNSVVLSKILKIVVP